jgi:hypothetical protein
MDSNHRPYACEAYALNQLSYAPDGFESRSPAIGISHKTLNL